MAFKSPRDDSPRGPAIPGLASKTSHETKRKYQSLPRSVYKLSVQETVLAGSKEMATSGFGVKNYPYIRKGTRGEFW